MCIQFSEVKLFVAKDLGEIVNFLCVTKSLFYVSSEVIFNFIGFACAIFTCTFSAYLNYVVFEK